MDVTIRGISVPDIDLLNADVLDAYENGLKELDAIRSSAGKGTSSQFIRNLCDSMRDWLDELLGEGMGDEVLPNDSMRDALTALRDIIAAMQQAQKEMKDIWSDLDVSRAPRQERRAVQQDRRRMEKRKRRRSLSAVPEATADDPYNPGRVGT